MGDTDEWDMWTSPQAVSPLRSYTQTTGYEPETTAKCIVDPERVHGFNIHMGALLMGEAALIQPYRDCGRVLHMPNMFRRRIERGSWNETWKDWQWVL